MLSKPCPERDELYRLIKESVARFEALPPEEQAEERRLQRESWVRAEMSWPKPRFKYENGVKVYESYEDYVNG